MRVICGWGARTAHVTFAVEAVKPRGSTSLLPLTSISIAKERCRLWSTTSIWVEHTWMYRTVWHTYGLYLLMTLGRALVCNNIPRDIPERDPPRTYMHTFVRIDPWFRSSIQSLVLMHSANIPANYSPRVSSVEIARSLILLLDQITIFSDKNKFGTHMRMQGSYSL